MKKNLICFLITFALCFNSVLLNAQYTAIHEIDSVMDLSPNYLPTYYANLCFIDFMPLIFKPIDTTMHTTHLFNPLLKVENIYQNLGINGQAHKSMIFDFKKEMGFVYLQLPYPLYFKKQTDLKFYKMQTTYSRIAYTFSFFKENELYAEFSKYMKGATVVANIYSTVTEGSFVHQATRNFCGDFLIHYELPSSVYGFRASYIINHLANQENGGLADVEAYQKERKDNNAGYEIRTPNATSKITTHDFALQNYVNLINKNNKYFGILAHDVQFTQANIIYKDKIEPTDELDDWAESVDSLRVNNIKNVIQWSNIKPFKEGKNSRNFFKVAGGIMHEYAEIKNIRTHFNVLYLFGRTHIRLFSVMDIFGKISSSVVSNYSTNDLFTNLKVSWAINRENKHEIGIGADFYRSAPDYFLQNMNNARFHWTTPMKAQNICQLNSYWNFQNYNISVNYFHLNNFVFISESLTPTQSVDNGNLIQFSAFIPFRYKNFGISSNINFQYCSKDVVHVPFFAGKLSVFYVFELLKKRLKIQIGSDLMYHTPFYADGYLPTLHSFYRQRTQRNGDFIFWDANLTVKIDRINFFFRVGNLLPPLMNYNNFTTPNYPTKEFLMSLGLSWRFFD